MKFIWTIGNSRARIVRPCNSKGSAKRWSPGLVNFVTALACHLCRTLLTAFTQPEDYLIAEPCTCTYLVNNTLLLCTDWFYGAFIHSSFPILIISGEQSSPRTAAASDGKAAGGPLAYTDIHVGPLQCAQPQEPCLRKTPQVGTTQLTALWL